MNECFIWSYAYDTLRFPFKKYLEVCALVMKMNNFIDTWIFDQCH